MGIAIVVHGGAWDKGVPDEQIQANKAGCLRSVTAGWEALLGGCTAVEAVERAICVLEDDPSFDAGRGSFLNADGRVQLDASIMDGYDLNTGAVAAVERVKNPISLARKVLETDWAFIVGEGATQFAKENGLEECSPWYFVNQQEIERWKMNPGQVLNYLRDERYYRKLMGPEGDTVGAVAMDSQGNIAAGTSTGGSPNKPVGRVGDSPLIGCGTYADNMKGGASMTGPGELVIRLVLAKHAVDLLKDDYGAQKAAEASLKYLKERVGGIGGIIIIDRKGSIGSARTTDYMCTARMQEDLTEPLVQSKETIL